MSAYSDRIDRYMDAHPGASLAEARGHGSTPEHPYDDYARDNPRYDDYFERRDAYTDHAFEIVKDHYGDRERWSDDDARERLDHTRIEILEKADQFDTLEEFWEAYPEYADEFGHYH